MSVIPSLKRNWRLATILLMFVPATWIFLNPPCWHGVIPMRSFERFNGTGREPPDLTVVTAYFHLGRFAKGEGGEYFGPQLYLEWASVYEHIHNPLVVYTDTDQFVNMFKELRGNLKHITKIIKVEKNTLWAFYWLEQIRKIYSNPEYPKFHPNTVVPEYSCVQHAKYACVEDAIINNYFRTKYFTWLDIGYFRLIKDRHKSFRLILPPRFDERKIAINQVSFYTLHESPSEIFKRQLVWVGGGIVLGEKTVFLRFIADYKMAVQRYLNMSLSNSDQQVLFAMYTHQERAALHLRTELQLYVWDVFGSCWYYLGYQCYRELPT